VTVLLIPAGVFVNGAGGWIIAKLDLPLYLDSVGTFFVAATAGPLAGALTGLLTNLILGMLSPGYAPYWSVPLLLGLVAGLCANAGWFKRLSTVILTGLLCAFVAASASTLVAWSVFGVSELRPAYFLIEEPIDKVATALMVFALFRFLPKPILALLPRPENVKAAEK
jgi:energy-coupling factor transport system substrate-specific component